MAVLLSASWYLKVKASSFRYASVDQHQVVFICHNTVVNSLMTSWEVSTSRQKLRSGVTAIVHACQCDTVDTKE